MRLTVGVAEEEQHALPQSGISPGGWRRERLDAVTTGIFDCPHTTPILTTDGPYVARSQDIRSGILRVKQAAHVSLETYRQRIQRAEPNHGDLLFSREGTYFGVAAEVPANTKVCLGQRMVLIRPNAQLVNFRYLRFWLNSPAVAAHVNGFRDGSVAERLNMPTIRALPVALPSLSEQQDISTFLGALDDKIEVNRRTSETLETMARALFKSWFVDFDPVRAKSEGRKPAWMDAETAALFPAKLTSFEHDNIPQAWKVASVGSVAMLNSMALVPGDGVDSILYVEISGVVRGDVLSSDRYSRGAEPGRARRRVRHGDTVISMVRPERQAYFLALNPPKDLIVSTGFSVITPRTVPWSHLHASVARAEVFEQLGQLADGGAYPVVKPDDIGALKVVIPEDSRVLDRFHEIAAPLYLRAAQLRAESRTLAALRDTILPKLMSGELRIKDAEKIASAAL